MIKYRSIFILKEDVQNGTHNSLDCKESISSFFVFNQNAEAQVELVENGSFETGDFTGWTVVQEAGSAGDWFVYSGNTSPFGGPILSPPDGNVCRGY
jgi:hypothetical protein